MEEYIFDKLLKKCPEEDIIILKYYRDFYKDYNGISVDSESEELLNKFESVMLKDGRSDKNLIKLVSFYYRTLIIDGKEEVKNELLELIRIKEEINPNFYIKKSKEESCYVPFKGIYLNNYAMSVVFHEIGHALIEETGNLKSHNVMELMTHCFALDSKAISEKIVYLSRVYSAIKRQVFQEIRSKYKDYILEYISSEILGKGSFNEVRYNVRLYLLSNCDSSNKSLLINDLFHKLTYDDYYKHFLKTYSIRLNRQIIKNEFTINEITDIIDAIFKGKYKDKKIDISNLSDKEDFYRIGISGHGEQYYRKSDETLSATEIFANYCAIRKMDDLNQNLDFLASIVGQNIVDSLNELYNKVIRSQMTLEERGKRL